MDSHLDSDQRSTGGGASDGAIDDTWQKVVLENALDAVIGVNDRDIVVDWNRQAEVIFGWSREEATGQRMKQLIIPAEFRAAHEAGMARYLKTGIGPILNRRIEIKAQRKNGSYIVVELTVIPVRVHTSLFFYSFLRDISDRKRLEAERAQMAERERLARERLSLQYSVMEELAKAQSASGVVIEVIRKIGEQMNWEIGAFWSASTTSDHLSLNEFWTSPSVGSAKSFYESSKQRTFRRGEGVLGRVWTTGVPDWTGDVHQDDRFLRNHLATSCGLCTGFWLPVATPKKMYGVLEFLSRRSPPPDQDLIVVASNVMTAYAGAHLVMSCSRSATPVLEFQRNNKVACSNLSLKPIVR